MTDAVSNTPLQINNSYNPKHLHAEDESWDRRHLCCWQSWSFARARRKEYWAAGGLSIKDFICCLQGIWQLRTDLHVDLCGISERKLNVFSEVFLHSVCLLWETVVSILHPEAKRPQDKYISLMLGATCYCPGDEKYPAPVLWRLCFSLCCTFFILFLWSSQGCCPFCVQSCVYSCFPGATAP